MRENVRDALKGKELALDELDAVTGGTAAVPMPEPTGSVTYTCPVCGSGINASARDMTVTCPNVRCQSSFNVRNGKLLIVSRSL